MWNRENKDIENKKKLAEYRFNIEWANGKQKPIEEELTTSATIPCLAATIKMESLIQNNDKEYTNLIAHLQNTNYPPRNKTTAAFKNIWSDLSVADNGLILLKAGRLVIPNNKKEDILNSQHSSHAGIARTLKMHNNCTTGRAWQKT